MSTNLELLEQYNNKTENVIQQYNDRGILKKEIRSYEVSLWTLQDDFVTVLKWSDVEQKGRIENPKMTLNIDGTQKFNFTIPMYYQHEGKLIENPSWFIWSRELGSNGMIEHVAIKQIQGLRKIKVIFNKGKEYEEVFEFLIINVRENHEGDILTCEVESEGLAFQELGKIGYKLELKEDNLLEHTDEWSKNGYWTDHNGNQNHAEPTSSLDYWCQEGCHLTPYPGDNQPISSRTWYYTVQMNHKSFEETVGARNTAKIYEDSYVTNWNNDGSPVANSIVRYREKQRIMDSEHSNLYNLTQDIAKKFGVFCQYRYKYDENYHIIGRVIIFYNNFMREDLGTLAFTYPYTASRTERVIESTDVTTKLYVLSMEDETTLDGEHNIMNAEPNYSEEDYILNFDYMLETGAISQDQYDLIQPYLKEMRYYNESLKYQQAVLVHHQSNKTKWEARKTVYENSIKIDSENINSNKAYAKAITTTERHDDGYCHKEGANCDSQFIQKYPQGGKYISFTTLNKGIDTDSLKIYLDYANGKPSGDALSDQQYVILYDKFNNPSEVRFLHRLVDNNGVDLPKVYLEYNYKPELYYENIAKIWAIKLTQDQRGLATMLSLLGPKSTTDEEYNKYYGTTVGTMAFINSQNAAESHYSSSLYKAIEDTENRIKDYTRTKTQLTENFERAMGLAIREGYWQPEDYKDYGEKVTISDKCFLDGDDLTADSKKGIYMNFDRKLFDEEDKAYYPVGDLEDSYFYPCIDLQVAFGNNIPTYLDQLSVVWKKAGAESQESKNNLNEIHNLGIFRVGTDAVFKFLWDSDHQQPKPVLMLTGAKSLSDEDLRVLLTPNEGYARLELFEIKMQGETPTVRHDMVTPIYQNTWITHSYVPLQTAVYPLMTAYPRIKWSSLDLKTDTDSLKITYNKQLLEPYTDYYVNFRNTKRNNAEYSEYPEYFLTIKPEVFYKYGYNLSAPVIVQYTLSNANTAIYLDALKVSEENAKPKVSYEVTISACNTDLMTNLYNQLARIVMINDAQLKFENVFGYISQLDLDLDKPWEDSIEIKNYTSKFEDLFSSIIAQTEEMRRNEGAMSAMIAGVRPLSEEGLAKTLTNSELVWQAYIDSAFDTGQVVTEKLNKIFKEASDILACSNRTLNSVATQNIENNAILNGFAENVMNNLTLQVHTGPERPPSFKTGDIWIKTYIDKDGREQAKKMVATSNSSDYEGSGDDGFTVTHDGSLASITGAGLTYDAEEGTLEIHGQNSIDIKSGGTVYIGANDTISIVGNKTVGIGGSKINIVADATKSDWATGITMKSIGPNGVASFPVIHVWSEILDHRNFGEHPSANDDKEFKERVDAHITKPISGATVKFFKFMDPSVEILIDTNELMKDGNFDYDLVYSKLAEKTSIQSSIDLTPTKIAMSAAELEMKAASKIVLLASQGAASNTSAIQIDAETGVWVGAGAGIRLYSGATPTAVQVYVGPKHKTEFNEGDIWIKTTTATNNGTTYSNYDGHNGITFYTGKIMDLNDADYSSYFTISGIYVATKNYDAFNIQPSSNPSDSMTGWEVKASNTRANARNLLMQYGPNGSSVELNSKHLLLGYSNVRTNNSTAIEMTEEYLIIAAGNIIEDAINKDIIDQLAVKGKNPATDSLSLIGAKFTKDSIGFATGTGSNVNAILMNSDGISIGSGSVDVTASTTVLRNSTTGSYVRISGSGVEIGSHADLYINTDNLKLQTHSRASSDYPNNDYIDGNTILALGAGFNSFNNGQGITGKEDVTTLAQYAEREQNPLALRLVVNQTGVYVHGDIYARSFKLGPDAKIPEDKVDGLADHIDGFTSSMRAVYAIAEDGTTPTAPQNGVGIGVGANAAWSYTVPSYTASDSLDPTDNNYKYYNYYRAVQTITNDGTITYTPPVIDYGLSVTAQHATTASYNATNARNTNELFESNGLVADLTWGGNLWPVALTSTEKLLIGANTGLWICKPNTDVKDSTDTTGYSNGAAVVIDDSGIAMDAASIVIKSSGTTIDNTGTYRNVNNVVALDNTGITLGTSGNINMSANGHILMLTEGASTDPRYDSNGNYVRIINKWTDNNQAKLSQFDILPNYLFFGTFNLSDINTNTITSGTQTWLKEDGLFLQKRIGSQLTDVIDVLKVNTQGLYLNIEQSVHVYRGEGTTVRSTRYEDQTAHSIFHVKIEQDTVQGLYYRTQNYIEDTSGALHARDTHQYICPGHFLLRYRDTWKVTENNWQGRMSMIDLSSDGLFLFSDPPSYHQTVDTTAERWWEIMDDTHLQCNAIIKADGSGQIGGFTFNSTGIRKADDSMGFAPANYTNGVPFYINMPPGSPGNEQGTNGDGTGTKLAFYYQNGVVFIRELVYGTMRQESNPSLPLLPEGSSSTPTQEVAVIGQTAVTQGRDAGHVIQYIYSDGTTATDSEVQPHVWAGGHCTVCGQPWIQGGIYNS